MIIGAVDYNIHNQKLFEVQPKNRQTLGAIDKADDISEVKQEKSSEALNEQHDEYTESGNNPSETPGLYRTEKDEKGQQKIVLDRQKSPEKKEQTGTAAKNDNVDLSKTDAKQTKGTGNPEKKSGPEKSAGKNHGLVCTVNTDKVDAEIKKLKEKKQQIEQQLNSAHDDENKCKELEQQLSEVESEISAKDNDSYRKEHATYTYSQQ